MHKFKYFGLIATSLYVSSFSVSSQAEAVFDPQTGILSLEGVNIDGNSSIDNVHLRVINSEKPLSIGSELVLDSLGQSQNNLTDSDYSTLERIATIPSLQIQPKGKIFQYGLSLRLTERDTLEVIQFNPINVSSYDVISGQMIVPMVDVQAGGRRKLTGLTVTLQRVDASSGNLTEGADFVIKDFNKATGDAFQASYTSGALNC